MTRTATFTVSLSQAHVVAGAVNYATVNGSAKAGLDYTIVSGTLNFAAGETTKTVSVNIQAVSDRALDFRLKLSSPLNLTLLPPGSGTATIQPDNALAALVTDARAKLATANTALTTKNNAATAKTTAQTELNAATAAYNTAVTEKSAADAALAAATVNYNNAAAALNSANASGNAGMVLMAQQTYNDAVVLFQSAATRASAANTALTNTTTTKSQKQATYDSAAAAYTTAASAYTTAAAQAETARAAAAAGFVGSTSLVL